MWTEASSPVVAGAVWILFGLALVVSYGRAGVTGLDAVSGLFVLIGVGFVLAGVASIVRPGGSLLGLDYAAGETPAWVLVLVTLGSVAMLLGTTLEML